MRAPSLVEIAVIACITIAFVMVATVVEFGGLTLTEMKIIRDCSATPACVKAIRGEG